MQLITKMLRNYIGSQIKYVFNVLEKEFEEVISVNSLSKWFQTGGPLNLSERRPKWETGCGTDSLLYLVLYWWMHTDASSQQYLIYLHNYIWTHNYTTLFHLVMIVKILRILTTISVSRQHCNFSQFQPFICTSVNNTATVCFPLTIWYYFTLFPSNSTPSSVTLRPTCLKDILIHNTQSSDSICDMGEVWFLDLGG